MYFTSGSDRAFEQLMQTRPGADHFDSGEAGAPEDCGTCRFYRPHWKYQFCVYEECPYQPGKLTALDGAVKFQVKGVDDEMAVFRVEKNRGYTVMSNHHLRNKDLSLKAKGLLSQMLSLPEDWDFKRCEGPIELFGGAGLPITYHCGVNDYYKPDSPWLPRTNAEFGDLHYTLDLLEKYPDFVWVPAHGGGSCGGELEALAELAAKKGCKNVYVESSHRGVDGMHRMLELFGEDRIMFATDWPFDTTTWSVKYAEDAFAEKPEVAEKFFYANAARILGIE